MSAAAAITISIMPTVQSVSPVCAVIVSNALAEYHAVAAHCRSQPAARPHSFYGSNLNMPPVFKLKLSMHALCYKNIGLTTTGNILFRHCCHSE